MQKFLILLTILFITIKIDVAAEPQTNFSDLLPKEDPEIVKIVGTDTTRAVGKSKDSHLIQKCDSDRTVRRAHMFTAISDQKRLDNEWKMYVLQSSIRTVTEITGYDENGRPLTKTITEPTPVTSTVLEREEDKWGETGNTVKELMSVPLLLFGITQFLK